MGGWRLGVEISDGVRAGLDELVDVALGTLDHQVHVAHRPRRVRLLAQRRDDDRPDRDRRHEVPVHHIDVNHPRTRVQHLPDLLAQPPEVGGQNRRRHPHAAQQLAHGLIHMACSIESPQLLHLRIAVDDMRTIVECSPQLGHTDVSSKRRRQYTQR